MNDLKSVVTQLRSLASVKDNRALIIKDEHCIPSLITFLNNEEEDLVFTALEVLFILWSLELVFI
jgi:hypothetical protein